MLGVVTHCHLVIDTGHSITKYLYLMGKYIRNHTFILFDCCFIYQLTNVHLWLRFIIAKHTQSPTPSALL